MTVASPWKGGGPEPQKMGRARERPLHPQVGQGLRFPQRSFSEGTLRDPDRHGSPLPENPQDTGVERLGEPFRIGGDIFPHRDAVEGFQVVPGPHGRTAGREEDGPARLGEFRGKVMGEGGFPGSGGPLDPQAVAGGERLLGFDAPVAPLPAFEVEGGIGVGGEGIAEKAEAPVHGLVSRAVNCFR